MGFPAEPRKQPREINERDVSICCPFFSSFRFKLPNGSVERDLCCPFDLFKLQSKVLVVPYSMKSGRRTLGGSVARLSCGGEIHTLREEEEARRGEAVLFCLAAEPLSRRDTQGSCVEIGCGTSDIQAEIIMITVPCLKNLLRFSFL